MAITELDVGGAERAFVRVALGLRDRGWAVRVVSLRDAGPLAAELQSSGIPVVALGCGGLLDPASVIRMRRALRKEPPDVLLSFLHQANLVARIAGRCVGIRRIISSVRVSDRRAAVRLTERWTAGFVNHYAAVSHAVAKQLREDCGIDRNRITVIQNGVDVDAIDACPVVDRKSIGCSDEDFVFLFAGRLTRQKAPLDLLQGFHEVLKQNGSGRSVRLVIVGDGEQRGALVDEIQIRSLQPAVRMLGHRTDLHGIMKAADVLVLPSRWEGLSNVILEAHAARLPVIGSAVDGVAELMTDGITGRLFPSGDVQALTAAMTSAMLQPEVSTQMAHAARQQVERDFTWDRCIAGFAELLSPPEV